MIRKSPNFESIDAPLRNTPITAEKPLAAFVNFEWIPKFTGARNADCVFRHPPSFFMG
jgi:hypothetical protein